MQTKFYLLAFLIIFMSCKKEKDTTPKSSIKYTVNGSVYQFDGYSTDINNIKGSKIINLVNSGVPAYYILASDGVLVNSIALEITPNNTLSVTPYSVIKSTTSSLIGSELTLNNQPHYSTSIGDFTNVTITSITNGYASGTFTAKFTKYLTSTRVEVTNGVFSNIKIEN